jgi:hypothetical protein
MKQTEKAEGDGQPALMLPFDIVAAVTISPHPLSGRKHHEVGVS